MAELGSWSEFAFPQLIFFPRLTDLSGHWGATDQRIAAGSKLRFKGSMRAI